LDSGLLAMEWVVVESGWARIFPHTAIPLAGSLLASMKPLISSSRTE
jgi:hypothetical protein